MVSKWVISPTYKWGIPWGYNPRILTIDPNFQQDIQVGGVFFFHPVFVGDGNPDKLEATKTSSKPCFQGYKNDGSLDMDRDTFFFTWAKNLGQLGFK